MEKTVGRKPIGKRAMTAAERQARRRAKLRSTDAKAVIAGKRAAARDRGHAAYMPVPVGVTYWETVIVRLEDGLTREIWTPKSKPLAVCESDLGDDDVRALTNQLKAIAADRGLE